MKPTQLRRWMQKYGNMGVLMVAGYLVFRHVRHRRRLAFMIVSGGLCLLPMCLLLLHPGPRRRPAPVVAALPQPLPPPAVIVEPKVPLQDDTESGPPLQDADTDGPISANGDLFFASDTYHNVTLHEKDVDGQPFVHEKLEGNASSHIYRMRPDGSHRVQLTWGKTQEELLTLSPDGTQLAFWRRGEHDSLCMMAAQGGPIITLLRAKQEYFGDRPCWSPDGRYIAVVERDDDEAIQGMYLISVSQRTHRYFPKVADFAWAPDGRLYERDSSDEARIVNLDTNRTTPIHNAVHNPIWLDNHTLVGDVADPEWRRGSKLRFVNDHGKEVRHLELNLIGDQGRDETFLNPERTLFRLPHHPTTLILESGRTNRDGSHYGCYRVDIKTGDCRLIQNGAIVGIAPDGNLVATAEKAWFVGTEPHAEPGSYGPLQIVSLKTGRTRLVSDPLSGIHGGIWQPARPHRRRTRGQALLEAVEAGKREQVSALLAQGASANSHYAEGTTALMLAASDGRADIVALLLHHHANANARDSTGKSVLMWALGVNKTQEEICSDSQQKIVLRLLNAGARVNAADDKGDTALMTAAAFGRATEIPLLMKYGAAVDARNRGGRAALMNAAEESRPHTVQELLKTANPNLKDECNDTARDLAAVDRREDRAQRQAETIAVFDRPGVNH